MIADIPTSASEIRAQQGVAAIEGEDDLGSADADDIAPFTVFLASDYAANVNGQTFLGLWWCGGADVPAQAGAVYFQR